MRGHEQQPSTNISTVSSLNDEEETEEIGVVIDPDNLSRHIVDLSIPLSKRIEALNMFYQKDSSETLEMINKLCAMYELSNITMLKEYLYEICTTSLINPFLKSICAKVLCANTINGNVDAVSNVSNVNDTGYRALEQIYPQMDASIGTPYKIDLVKLLMKSTTHRAQALTYFIDIVNNDKLDCDFRYKTVLGLENSELKKDSKEYFILETLKVFVRNTNNKIMYKVLAGQYLLKNECYETEQILIDLASDESNDYNSRADAADVLLQYGSDQAKTVAKKLIMILGKINDKRVYTIYDNAQNVHTEKVEGSIKDALEFLYSFNLLEHNGEPITFEYVKGKILESIHDRNPEVIESISVSLNRIYMDRAVYSQYSCSLANILCRVWTYLVGHQFYEQIKDRLIEELNEMSGTCSSGFASRLINTLSGFGDFSIKISWKDQIVANLKGRLNAKARELDNITLQERVLVQMSLDSSNYEERKHFLKFFRENVLSIREEMEGEFVKYIKPEEFDLHFRTAILMYETGHM